MSLEKSSIECDCVPYRGFHCEKHWGKHWLDKYIAQQAAHYGMSVDAYNEFMRSAAQYDEENPHL